MQNILIRADSSSTIGTGHIIRTLTLAEQFNGSNIIFATQELKGNINQKILDMNYSLVNLPDNSVHFLVEQIKSLSINLLIIDHYGINHSFEKEIKKQTKVKLFVLDDTYKKHYCDILLNHNIYAKAEKYINLLNKDCEIRCGEKHTLLRNEFFIEKKGLRRKKNIYL